MIRILALAKRLTAAAVSCCVASTRLWTARMSATVGSSLLLRRLGGSLRGCVLRVSGGAVHNKEYAHQFARNKHAILLKWCSPPVVIQTCFQGTLGCLTDSQDKC